MEKTAVLTTSSTVEKSGDEKGDGSVGERDSVEGHVEEIADDGEDDREEQGREDIARPRAPITCNLEDKRREEDKAPKRGAKRASPNPDTAMIIPTTEAEVVESS